MKAASENTLNIKIGTIAIVFMGLMNVVIVGPASWLVSNWKERYESDVTRVVIRMEKIEEDIDDLFLYVHGECVDRFEYEKDKSCLENRINLLSSILSGSDASGGQRDMSREQKNKSLGIFCSTK